MQATDTFDVTYYGFVHVDKPSGGLPDAAAVQKAATLLKSGRKEARKIHPLFARGLETPLQLSLNESGLKVTVNSPGTEAAVVLNHPIHKIAYVCDIGSCVCFIVKRQGPGQFKCHSFEAHTAKQARVIALQTAHLCNEIFNKVRRVSNRIKKKKGVPTKSKEDDVVGIVETEKDDKLLQEVLKEMSEEGGEQKDGSGEGKFEFLDGVTDQIADLVLGGSSKPKTSSLKPPEVSLDDDMFSFGEISGDVDC